MCLCTKEKDPKIAEGDILTYKIIASKKNVYYTPYRDYIIQFNIRLEDIIEEDIKYLFNVYMIESGYFHSYTDLESAKKEFLKLKKKMPKNIELKIYDSIIPKGTPYYIGMRSDICSKSIIIKEDDQFRSL